MDCTYFQNKCLFSIIILSLSHDLVLGKPMNVVFMCILELLNPSFLCLLPTCCWWDALVAVVWNATRRGLELPFEFRLQHGLSWM